MTTLSNFTLKICKFLDTFLRVSVNQGNVILKNRNNYKIIVSLRTFNTSPLLFLPLYFKRKPSCSYQAYTARFVLQISEAVNKNQFDRAVREESEFIIE